jgi:hypothetical protein
MLHQPTGLVKVPWESVRVAENWVLRIVQIGAIHIQKRFHASLLPLINAGATPKGVAPRPAAEANRRDLT